MTQRDNILQELVELNSSLSKVSAENVYHVPAGYFDGLAAFMLKRIKAMDVENVDEELKILSSNDSVFSKENIYNVPQGYFEGLAEAALQKVRTTNDDTAIDELETLSPMLSSLKNKNPYSVPQGYFDTTIEAPKKEIAKVVSITSRKWFRYAVAATLIGFVALGGLIFIRSNKKIDPKVEPVAFVTRVVKNYPKQVDAFIKLVDETSSPVSKDVVTAPVSTAEVKELMKDVSDKEIQDFLSEIPESSTEPDAAMN